MRDVQQAMQKETNELNCLACTHIQELPFRLFSRPPFIFLSSSSHLSVVSLSSRSLRYEHVYDRVKLLGKSIQDCQYIACMNPTAGSFTINPRLQRHFVSFAVGFPGPTSLLTIYETFLMGHLQNGPKPFSEEVCEIGKHIIQGALELHQGVGQVRGEREEREADRGEKRGEKRGERRREKKREERRERRRERREEREEDPATVLCVMCRRVPCAGYSY